MRATIQRVSEASVQVNSEIKGEIKLGFLILLGIGKNDSEEDIEYLSSKIATMRIFNDEDGKMNQNIRSVQGNCLVISQFTLFASTRKGHRPSFIDAAPAEISEDLYDKFCVALSSKIGQTIEKGVFGAHMKVSLCNDGPVTINIDSKNR